MLSVLNRLLTNYVGLRLEQIKMKLPALNVTFCYRILYWLCWKSGLLVPLLLMSLAFVALLSLVDRQQQVVETGLVITEVHTDTASAARQQANNRTAMAPAVSRHHVANRTKRPDKQVLETPFAQLPFVPGRSSRLYYNASLHMPMEFQTWLDNEVSDCSSHFTGYMGEFAHVKGLVINRQACQARQGGEQLHRVLNQSEESEYIHMKYGCMQLRCQQKIDYFFNGDNHLNTWLLHLQQDDIKEKEAQVKTQFTIAVTRYEYVNFYHSMTDWYNAFLLMNFFNRTQQETNILIVDAHPAGSLDPVWVALFNSTQRFSTLSWRTQYTDLVWSMLGYNSLFTDHLGASVPLLGDFRDFFLNSWRIQDTKVLDCAQLSILFVWRHNYVAHPRNPTGTISRKMKNEQELLDTMQRLYPGHNIRGLQLDLLDMRTQLQIIVNTDILMGMHGAGLTHTLFLPQHAGLIEFIPAYWSAANEHFMAMARWRKLVYERWVNMDPVNEYPHHYTYIPPYVGSFLLQKVVQQLCARNTTTVQH